MKLKMPKMKSWSVNKAEMKKYSYSVMKGEEKKEENLTEFNFIFKVWKGKPEMGGRA